MDVHEQARTVQRFLADENIQAALQSLKQQNYGLFLRATTTDGRAMAQAQAVVLESFEATLRGVVDAGELATRDQERRDRAPAP